jgi:uncharacterized protein (TIGR00730 family)
LLSKEAAMSQPHSEIPNTAFESILESDSPDAIASPIDEYVEQIKQTAEKLKKDGCGRGDAKLLAMAFKELRHSFRVFAAYRDRRKVTVFGSARTKPDHPAYLAAIEYGRRMAEAGYMVITGAAAGIMEAGHLGAGRENSFGLNILLPFEQAPNEVMQGDAKLMNMRYFFTRKLAFIKESDAVALFPGGFGTHDEAFETLTLIQTGKSHIFPLVLVDEPGGTYWHAWQQFVDAALLKPGYISPQDRHFYRITDSIDDAVQEVTQFYRVYHSMRYVKRDLVLRLQSKLSAATLTKLQAEFADIIEGEIVQTDALAAEANEPELSHLPRLKCRFDRVNNGRLRQLIDAINREG